MKSRMSKIIAFAVIVLLVSLTVKEETFLQLDKKEFKKDELITGRAYLNTVAMKAIANKRDAGYCAYDDEYNLISNAIQLRIAPNKKDQYSSDGYVVIKNAITVKNDTAIISFKVPQSLIKADKTQTMEIRVNRQWTMRGKDTTFVFIKQFEIF